MGHDKTMTHDFIYYSLHMYGSLIVCNVMKVISGVITSSTQIKELELKFLLENYPAEMFMVASEFVIMRKFGTLMIKR